MQENNLVKVNLGCGNKRKSGFIGVDKFHCDAVDKIADIEESLPFEDNSVDEILMDNVIEHIRDIPKLMYEIHRVCKNNADIKIITPHFSSIGSWRDPTHVHHLTLYSMDHFEKPNVKHYTGGGFKVIDRRLTFGGGGPFKIIGNLLYKYDPRRYEKKWCLIFRAGTVHYHLRVIKE